MDGFVAFVHVPAPPVHVPPVALPPTEPPIAADVPLWQIADNAAPAFAVGAGLVAVPPIKLVQIVPLYP